LAFRLERLLATADTSTVEGRARTARGAAALVAEHPSDLVRDQYAVELSERLGIDVDRIRATVAGAARGERAPGFDRSAPSRPQEGIDRRELDVLRWAIHRPELLADWLDAGLFADPTARAVFELLDGHETFRDALDAAEPRTRVILERLAVEEPPEEHQDPTTANLLYNTVVAAAERLQRRLMDAGDDQVLAVNRSLDELRHAREIGDFAAGETAAKQLLGWISAAE